MEDGETNLSNFMNLVKGNYVNKVNREIINKNDDILNGQNHSSIIYTQKNVMNIMVITNRMQIDSFLKIMILKLTNEQTEYYKEEITKEILKLCERHTRFQNPRY